MQDFMEHIKGLQLKLTNIEGQDYVILLHGRYEGKRPVSTDILIKAINDNPELVYTIRKSLPPDTSGTR